MMDYELASDDSKPERVERVIASDKNGPRSSQRQQQGRGSGNGNGTVFSWAKYWFYSN